MCLPLIQLSDQLLNYKSIETLFWRRKINSSLFFDKLKIDTGLRRLECHNYFRLSCCRCRCVRSECWADSRTQSLCCWLQSRSLWRGHRTKRWTQTCCRSEPSFKPLAWEPIPAVEATVESDFDAWVDEWVDLTLDPVFEPTFELTLNQHSIQE
jgi:hypothetical protein